jgi:hypothetical protein
MTENQLPELSRSLPPRRLANADTEFDWHIYADATFAGLSVLLPIPFVDAILEEIFRRRMPRNIARWRGRTLPQASYLEINRTREGCWPGCLLWPVEALLFIIRTIYRNIIFVLSVYDASVKLSYYWHRAFLLDYMIRRGDLDTPMKARLAGAAMQEAMGNMQLSPFINLAGQVIDQARQHIGALMKSVFRFIRRHEATKETERTWLGIAEQWAGFKDYLLDLAGRYDTAYETQAQAWLAGTDIKAGQP